MTKTEKEVRTPDSLLKELKQEGAELLIQGPDDGTADRARLDVIDAKIEQLTSPITTGEWSEPTD